MGPTRHLHIGSQAQGQSCRLLQEEACRHRPQSQGGLSGCCQGRSPHGRPQPIRNQQSLTAKMGVLMTSPMTTTMTTTATTTTTTTVPCRNPFSLLTISEPQPRRLSTTIIIISVHSNTLRMNTCVKFSLSLSSV